MAEKPEDLNLPNSVIVRLVKDAVPDGVNVSKDARSAFSRAASIFVLYTTSCANNFALKAKRKTLTGSDVMLALEDMEFERFIEPIKSSFEAFRQEKSKKDSGNSSGKGRKRKDEVDNNLVEPEDSSKVNEEDSTVIENPENEQA